MQARGSLRTPCALMTFALLLFTAGITSAWERKVQLPEKIRFPQRGASEAGIGPIRASTGSIGGDWGVPAGQAQREILCPKRGFAMAIGARPFFSSLVGSVKALSRGGEGTYVNLHGHLRLPSDVTQWELYAHMRTWDKVMWRVEYQPWSWSGAGHTPAEGNFAGLLLLANDPVDTQLNISTVMFGADYDVTFGRDLIFGPNGDFHVIKWSERIAKGAFDGADFSHTILQPAIGAHVRYEPTNTGYFSWFKPSLEGRFSWMNVAAMGLSTWDVALAFAPPLSRNVDAGIRAGYKQWKLDGSRSRLFVDVGVEGFYLDFSLRF
jgi:hypothetical protein